MDVHPKLICRVLDSLPIGPVRSRLSDQILKTMNEAQIYVMKRWHSYICPKCGHAMIANTPLEEES